MVHLAATGDEGFSLRREYIAKPLLEKGIASVVLQVPFYGKRRYEYVYKYMQEYSDFQVDCHCF